jgi:hypothetical protein
MYNRKSTVGGLIAGALAVVAVGAEMSGQDRSTLKVPNGLAFAEFRGYEGWQTISVSHNGEMLAVILGNPTMIEAFKGGTPGNGKPFPDGARMAKIHWAATKSETEPGQPLVAGPLHDVDFMVKDSKRFGDSGGWGYGAFEYDNTSKTFRPANTADKPPQGNDARCGFGCHTLVAKQDYVFTHYAGR